jgi:hypothetical protein
LIPFSAGLLNTRALCDHRPVGVVFRRNGGPLDVGPSDQLAAPFARDGDPEPIDIQETETNFTIGWKGHYCIEGGAFVYTDRKSGRVTAILGYPTAKIAGRG